MTRARTRGGKGRAGKAAGRTPGAAPATTPPRDPWRAAADAPIAPAVQTAAAGAAGAGQDAVAADPAAKLAAELAGLTPAERYERLIDFPTDHPFKVIGAADQAFADRLRAALDGLGHAGVALQPRFSSGARYAAYTVTLRVASGAALVRIYEVLGALPGLKYLL